MCLNIELEIVKSKLEQRFDLLPSSGNLISIYLVAADKKKKSTIFKLSRI
jgi:hypothetical protein